MNSHFNTLRPRQDGRHFADDIFMCVFFNEKCCILIKCSLKYVRKGPIDNNPALVQIMAWRRSGDKPLSEPMMINLPTHICVTRPQWVKDRTVSRPSYLYNGNPYTWPGKIVFTSNFIMRKQGISHFFHLHARAPPATVLVWVVERMPQYCAVLSHL